MREESISAGAKGNAYGLSIAERFYLLAVVLESDDITKVCRAYGILTGTNKTRVTDYIRDLCSGIDMQRKYNGRAKKTEAEKAETKRRYYLAHKEETLERNRQWRKANPEKVKAAYQRHNEKRRKRTTSTHGQLLRACSRILTSTQKLEPWSTSTDEVRSVRKAVLEMADDE